MGEFLLGAKAFRANFRCGPSLRNAPLIEVMIRTGSSGVARFVPIPVHVERTRTLARNLLTGGTVLGQRHWSWGLKNEDRCSARIERTPNEGRSASNRAATYPNLFWSPLAWLLQPCEASGRAAQQGPVSPLRSLAAYRNACWPFPSPWNREAVPRRDPATGKRVQFASNPVPGAAPPSGRGNAHKDPARESTAAPACRSKSPLNQPFWPRPMPKAEWLLLLAR